MVPSWGIFIKGDEAWMFHLMGLNGLERFPEKGEIREGGEGSFNSVDSKGDKESGGG